jgi:hypothetical protein
MPVEISAPQIHVSLPSLAAGTQLATSSANRRSRSVARTHTRYSPAGISSCTTLT